MLARFAGVLGILGATSGEVDAACDSGCVSPECRMHHCPDGEGDSRHWYCRDGWTPHGCDDEGNIKRYYQSNSPYRDAPWSLGGHRNRYGSDD